MSPTPPDPSAPATPPGLYRILDREARGWWYHVRLREEGKVAEARQRERASIRHTLATLREALTGGYLAIGRGGWTLHVSDNCSVSHCGSIEQPTPKACLLLGIPILDSTTVPDDRLLDLIRLPMVGIQRRSPRPWGAMSFAPFGYVAARQVALGATLYVPDGWTDPDYLAERTAAP